MTPDRTDARPHRPGSEDLGDAPDPEVVASRADGRPPEESSSVNPEVQAQAILEESEQRIADGAHAADPIDGTQPATSDGAQVGAD